MSKSILDAIFSQEDYEQDADYTPEDGTPVVDTKGDSDNGPETEDPESLQNADQVDDTFNDEHTDPDPASVEELMAEEVPSEEEIEDTAGDPPPTIEDSDVTINADTVEVQDSDVDVDANDASIDASDNAMDDAEAAGEVGVDPEQAIECIIRGREEDIRLIANGTEVNIDEQGNVGVDSNSGGDMDTGDNDNNDGGDDMNNGDDNNDNSDDDNNNSDDNNGGGEDMNDGNNDMSGESLTFRRLFS